MLRMRRIVGALLLTALILADGAQLLGSPPGVDGVDQFDQAGLFPLKAYWMKKNYNSEGEFIGCSGKGTNCLVFTFAFGSADMSVSSEGVHMQ
ncbi:MAG: hypothetical protein KAW61_05680 [candidate division Zixibacteria bacterium]|nr:hypothetical protein [candidate division Zixibacteria bacterium]